MEDLEKALDRFSYPALLKARTGSYDGKGNLVIHSPEEVSIAFDTFKQKGPLMLERYINFTKEISVLVARDILYQS